jgi:hypothetical protein
MAGMAHLRSGSAPGGGVSGDQGASDLQRNLGPCWVAVATARRAREWLTTARGPRPGPFFAPVAPSGKLPTSRSGDTRDCTAGGVFCNRNPNQGLHGTGSAVESSLEAQPTSSVRRKEPNPPASQRPDSQHDGMGHCHYRVARANAYRTLVSIPNAKALHVCGFDSWLS